MRLFVALPVPVATAAALASAIAPLRTRAPRARWVRGEQLHVTFAFLGETDAATTERLRPVLRDALASAAPVAAETAEFGAFPVQGRVRVVWAALRPEAELARLARRVRAALDSAGAAYDDKPFRAHVTLARSDPPWPTRWRDDLAAIDGRGGRVPCDALALVASTLAPGGATHRTVDSFALGVAGDSA